MDSHTDSRRFVDRLEQYLLDGVGELEHLQEEIALSIESARYSGATEYRTALQALARLLESQEPLDDTDVLPLIFTLREADSGDLERDEDGDAAGTGETKYVRFDIPFSDAGELVVNEEDKQLVREAVRHGNGIYVIDVLVPERYREAVTETIEAEFPVIRRAIDQNGRLKFLVVSDHQPKPRPIIERLFDGDDSEFEIESHGIGSSTVLMSPSIARSWYDRIPDLSVQTSYEDIERVTVLFDEIRRSTLLQNGVDENVLNLLGSVVRDSMTVNLADLFQKLKQPIELLCRDLRKEVSIRVGGDTDNVVVGVADVLGEAVFELVTNAIQHGIESPEEREASAKDPVGSVHILLRGQDDRLIVRVHDDGRGVDTNEIKRAHGKGGGLGRVRESVNNRFGGQFSLRTSERGTTAEIRIPHVKGMYRAIVFQRGGEYFAAPATFVSDTQNLEKEDVVFDVSGTPFVRREGHVIPFVEPSSEKLFTKRGAFAPYAVILQLGERPFAVAGDRVEGELLLGPDPSDLSLLRAEQIGVPIKRVALG